MDISKQPASKYGLGASKLTQGCDYKSSYLVVLGLSSLSNITGEACFLSSNYL